MPLPRSFYERRADHVARALLGRHLMHRHEHALQVGRIVETEAYVGTHDLACHASKGRTARTEVMFGPPGHAYVYLIYGMYHCFNVVTGPVDTAAAVLIRAVAPVAHIEGKTDGPGKLCRAMHITRRHDGLDLTSDGQGALMWLEPGEPVGRRRVRKGPRVGVDYAGEWANKELRFWVEGEPCVSRPRR